MSQAAKAQEPSMEEILASIRRIIADDDATKASAPPPPPPPKPAPAPVAPPAPKIAQPAPPPPPPAPAPAPPKASNNQDDIDAMLAELDAMPAQKEPPPKPASVDKSADNDILELTEAMAAPAKATPGFRTIDGKSDVVFNEPPEKPAPRPGSPASMVDLARRQFEAELSGPALMSANTTAAVDSAFNTLAHTVLSENSRTLEDLVKEMLRPLLKTWLDDNLPGMVERLVRAEIERVSRGRVS